MKAMKYLHALAAAGAIGLASAGLHAHSPSDAQALADLWAQAFNSRDVGAAMGSGHFAQIWRLDGDEWRIDRGVWSDDAAMHE